MNAVKHTPIGVTQAIRDAAAELYLRLDDDVTPSVLQEVAAIYRGERDTIPAVQFLAEHNAQALKNHTALVATVKALLEKHITYHNSIEHASARALLRQIEGVA